MATKPTQPTPVQAPPADDRSSLVAPGGSPPIVRPEDEPTAAGSSSNVRPPTK